MRLGRKLTQAQLAEAADLSTNFVGEIERGESMATLESLFRLADALDANPSRLFDTLDRPEAAEETIRRIRELLDALESGPKR